MQKEGPLGPWSQVAPALALYYRFAPPAVLHRCGDGLPGHAQMISVLDSAGPAVHVCAACTFPTGTENTRGKALTAKKWAAGRLWPLLYGGLPQ